MKWINQGGRFTQIGDNFSAHNIVTPGIYNINVTKGLGGGQWYLERYADEFTFPFKIYGLETEFIDYVVKTYHSTTGNFGVLLNGVKGTGKTIVAKMIANRLNLPVVILKNMGEDFNQDMLEFISSFNFDCIFFIDEFEKEFSDQTGLLLKITDGVYTATNRRLFLMTTNKLEINHNFIGRPSRIRYVKNFGNLSLDVVNEYLDAELLYPDMKEEIIEYIDGLSISTIDILKSLVEEVNIHHSLSMAKSVFNVAKSVYNYNVIAGFPKIDDIKVLIPEFISCVNNVLSSEDSIYDAVDKIKSHYFRYFDDTYLRSTEKLINLRPGDTIDRELIVYADYSKSIIATRESSSLRLYYVLNPDVRSSIYHNPDAF